MDEKDITATGPVGLSGIRNEDLYKDKLKKLAAEGDENAQYLILSLKPERINISTPGVVNPEGFFHPILEPYDSPYKELGKSVYDEPYIIGNNPTDILEHRALEQSGITLLANGLLKFGTTAATTFLDGTVGLLYGIGTAITTDKSLKQALWDNDFNKKMVDFLEKMEDIAPNYYSREELNSPWYTNIFTPNFIGDKVLKNAGFTVGALGAMAATSFVGGGAGSLFSSAGRLVAGGARALGAGISATKNILKAGNTVGLFANYITNTMIMSNGEASIEAYNAVKDELKLLEQNARQRYNEVLSLLNPNDPTYYRLVQLLDLAYNQYMEEASKKLIDAGNSVWALNMGILSASNMLEFTNLLKGGFNQTAKLSDFGYKIGGIDATRKQFARGILNGEKGELTNEVNKSFGRKAGLTVKNILSEASEEASQNLASNTAQMATSARMNEWQDSLEMSLLGLRINPEVTKELVDYTKAFNKALKDNFGALSSPGWEEAFLGGLTGGMGFITVKRLKVKGDDGEYVINPETGKFQKKWKVTMAGGFWDANRQVNEEFDENQRLIDLINERLSSEDFIKRTQHAVSKLNMSEVQRNAIENDDIFTFKNSEMGLLIEDVLFFRDKGLMDTYKDIFEEMQHVDDKTLQQIYTASEDASGQTPLAKEELEKVRNEYLEKAKSNLAKIETIQDYYDAVNENFKERSSDFKEEMTFYYSLLDDTKQRIEKIENTIKENEGTPKETLDEKNKEDLKKLKDQEEALLKKIDLYTKNPLKLEMDLILKKMKAEQRAFALNSEKVLTSLQAAKTPKDVMEIMTQITPYRDNTELQELLNQAYKTTKDSANQEALRHYVGLVEASNEVFDLIKNTYDTEELQNIIRSLFQSLLSQGEYDLAKVQELVSNLENNYSVEELSKYIQPDAAKTIPGYTKDFLLNINKILHSLYLEFDIWRAEAAKRKQKETEKKKEEKKEEKKTEKKKESPASKGKTEPEAALAEELAKTTHLKLYAEKQPANFYTDKTRKKTIYNQWPLQKLEEYIDKVMDKLGYSEEDKKDPDKIGSILLRWSNLMEDTNKYKSWKNSKQATKKAAWEVFLEMTNPSKKPESKPEPEKPKEEPKPEKTYPEFFNEVKSLLYGDNDITEALEDFIINAINETVNLITQKKGIPDHLKAIANIIEGNKSITPEVVKEPTPFILLSETAMEGNIASPFDVTAPIGTIIPKNSLNVEKFYPTVEDAEKTLRIIDNVLRFLKDHINKNLGIRLAVATNNSNPVLISVVKYDDVVKNYVKRNEGWIINTLDGEYLVLGCAGYTTNVGKKEAFQEKRAKLVEEAEKFDNPYYVSDTYKFGIANISDGNMIDSINGLPTVSVLEMLDDTTGIRNPRHLTHDNLKWGIVYEDGMHTIGFNSKEQPYSRKSLALTGESSDLGKVYLYIPTASGTYYRHLIKAIRYSDMKDGKLKNTIQSVLKRIIDNKQQLDVLVLKNLLVFAKNDFFINFTDDNKIVVVYNNGTERTEVSTVEDLDKIVKFVNPRVNVTLDSLKSEIGIQELSEAGALTPQSVKVLGNMLAGFLIRENLTPVKDSGKESKPIKSGSLKTNKRTIIIYNGKQYQISEANPIWTTTEGKAVTDKTIEKLLKIFDIERRNIEGISITNDKGKELPGVYYFTDIGIFIKNPAGSWKKLTAKQETQVKKYLDIMKRDQKNPPVNDEVIAEVDIPISPEEAPEENPDELFVDFDILKPLESKPNNSSPLDATPKENVKKESTTELTELEKSSTFVALITNSESQNYDTLIDALIESGKITMNEVDNMTVGNMLLKLKQLGKDFTVVSTLEDFDKFIVEQINC